MPTRTYALSGLHCNSCVQKLKLALAPHASAVQVSLSPMQAVLTDVRASLAQLQTAASQAGPYTLSVPEAQKNQVNQPQAHIELAGFAINSEATKKASWLTWLQTYHPLLLILAFTLLASIGVQLGQGSNHDMPVSQRLHALCAHETMRYFMAGFFLVFAFFKLLDVRAFAQAYASYDLLAARWQPWGLIYPFIELALGMAYLTRIAPTATAWITIAVMGFSALGVIRAVASKQRIRCACLGSVFNLPMSTVTIVEDVGMVLMAALMLGGPGS